MLNWYIKTRTNCKPPSKQDLKEESCPRTGETSFKRSIYILDTSNIQIAGWASLNLVWKQTLSAVCLLTCLLFFLLACFFLLAFGHFSQHPCNTQQQRLWRSVPTLPTHLTACFAFSTHSTNSRHPWAFIAWLFIQLPSLNSSGRPMSDFRRSAASEKPPW